jgi:glucokinase
MGAIIVADVGGTQMRVAALPRDGIQPIKHQISPTQAPKGSSFERFVALINAVWPDEAVEAISVATAGPLDPKTGTILSAPNIPEWINFPLGERLAEHFGVPVYVGNDANLALLGEWRYGAGQGHHDLIYITISTGIGGGVIGGDQLLLGHRGLAAELGHITVLPGGPLCPCGQRGHLEAISSGPAIARFVNEKLAEGETSILEPGPGLSARDVAKAARRGDPLAKAAYTRAGEFLGQAMADFLHIFNPSIVIFGGGVSRSGSLIFDPLKDALYKQVMDPGYVKNLILTTTKLGDDAGLIGAQVQAQIRLSSL